MLRAEPLHDRLSADFLAVFQEALVPLLNTPAVDSTGCGGVDLLQEIEAVPPFHRVAACIPGAVGGEPESQLAAVVGVEEQCLQGGPEEDQAVFEVCSAGPLTSASNRTAVWISGGGLHKSGCSRTAFLRSCGVNGTSVSCRGDSSPVPI